MLEHRNVVNFFVAMDEVIDHDPPGVWLAVTSLSFDISVLELLWTLTRGFHVVLKSDRGIAGRGAGDAAPAAPPRPVTFSLFYFAAGEDAAVRRLPPAARGARFADRNGFEAVWTPERHFHAFGGAYPNPSVTGAALAAITTQRRHPRRQRRAAAALADPRRRGVGGRRQPVAAAASAISFAAGWQPNDFVLNPTAYANGQGASCRDRSSSCSGCGAARRSTLPGHDGAPVDGAHAARGRCRPSCRSGSRRPAPGDVRAGRDARRQRAHPPARPVGRAARPRTSSATAPRGATPGTPARAASR